MKTRSKLELISMLDDVDSVVQNAPEDAIFDVIETHKNVTVEVLRNSKTGEVSIGWWRTKPINPPVWRGEDYDNKRRLC